MNLGKKFTVQSTEFRVFKYNVVWI